MHYTEPTIACPVCNSATVIHLTAENAIFYECMNNECRHLWKVLIERRREMSETYEKEIAGLKAQLSVMIARCKQLEENNERRSAAKRKLGTDSTVTAYPITCHRCNSIDIIKYIGDKGSDYYLCMHCPNSWEQ